MNKYIKYKNKYHQLKNMLGGNDKCLEVIDDTSLTLSQFF